MAEMTRHESLERFGEGIAKAEDRARQLAKSTANPMWGFIADELAKMRTNGLNLAKQKALTEAQTMAIVDKYHKNRPHPNG